MPGLGDSDHVNVRLIPSYITKLKQVKPFEKTVKILDVNGSERLLDCFERTEWQVFTDACEDLDELNDCVTQYISFCENICSVDKKIKVFNNSKPWINKDLKSLIISKHKAHKTNEHEKLKRVKNELKTKIKASKYEFKDKVNTAFENMASKDMWSGLKSMAGMTNNKKDIPIQKGKEQEYCEQLNAFYARFDDQDFSTNIAEIKSELCENLSNEPPFVIKEHEVMLSFKKLKQGKASGPDHLSPKVLKLCARQLSSIFCIIFNSSIRLCRIPVLWKTSKIVPVPKSSSINQMNDLRPVALTSVAMKCLEKIVLKNIQPICAPSLDNYQYAYKANRSVEDAILFFTNNLYQHLDRPKSYVRTLFIDFSSAFNTIQPHILIPKLKAMNFPDHITLWILDFLTERPQFVFIKLQSSSFTSGLIITNTGAPQGTVLAPVLFSIYTNDCQTLFKNIPIIKYADDTSIQALISSDIDLTHYYNEIDRFVSWCDSHYLLLNVKKTKELIFDFRKNNNTHDNIVIKGEVVERVVKYKYLGVLFDENLDWEANSKAVQSKVNQRVYFMYNVAKFNIDSKILSLFYESCIVSVITFCITAWGGNMREKQKSIMNSSIKRCNKLLKNDDFGDIDQLLFCATQKKFLSILKDQSHPLYSLIHFSVRSKRIIHVKTRTCRHYNSFLPMAIIIY